jgi:regulator of protease activity HflC (stomatin/prohibitin superfamily)
MSGGFGFGFGLAVSIVVMSGIGGCAYYLPQYNVYSQRLSGEARLAEAESSREIKVREAKALFDAADFTAKAEVRKAEGVAEANKILSDSLGGPEGYLRWKYIDMLENTAQKNTTIYIPTEAGLPILEAGKRSDQ